MCVKQKRIEQIPLSYIVWFLLFSCVTPNCRADFPMPQDYWVYDGLKIPGRFTSIAIGPNDLIYLSTNGTAISVFTLGGTLIRQFGSFGDIRGIAVDSQTNVYVLDRSLPKIKVFDSNGGSLREWGSEGNGNGQFSIRNDGQWPVNDSYNLLAIDQQNRVYLADCTNHRVQVFDTQGNFILKWGQAGGGQGNFVGPRCIGVLPSGNVCVWSAQGGFDPRSFQIFDPQGNFLKGQFTGQYFFENFGITPDGLIVTENDPYGHAIKILDQDRKPLRYFKSFDGEPDTPGGTISLRIPSDQNNEWRIRGFAFDKSGNMYFVTQAGYSLHQALFGLKRSFQVDNKILYNAIPLPVIPQSKQRIGTTLVDIDYKVLDGDSSTVQVAMLAFKDGNNDLGQIVKMTAIVENTLTNLGFGIKPNQTHRVTWDAAIDWNVGFGNIQFEILAKDERGLLPIHFITVPASGANPALTLSHQPVTDVDLLSLWYWLIATSDSAISFVNGQVKGVGGAFDGQVLATGSSTTTAGRNFLFQRLNLRIPTSAEITRAQSGRYGFGSVSANSVAKLP